MKQPAECFPVGEYIRGELTTRGWIVAELAERMGGDEHLNRHILAAIMCVPHPRLYLDAETAEQLARAFDTSVSLWLNLDKAWREWKEAKDRPPSAPGNLNGRTQ